MNLTDISTYEKVSNFARRQMLLIISLFFLALGVALCVRSDLGSSVISSAPYAFFLAGETGLAPNWTLGMYTNLLNVLLVAAQILVLRRRYRLWQLLQLLIGVVFGVLIDLLMSMTAIFASIVSIGLRLLLSDSGKHINGVRGINGDAVRLYYYARRGVSG